MGQFILKMRTAKAAGKTEKSGAVVAPKDAGVRSSRRKSSACHSPVHGGGRCLAVAR